MNSFAFFDDLNVRRIEVAPPIVLRVALQLRVRISLEFTSIYMLNALSENADVSLVTFATDQLAKQLENNTHSVHYSKITALQRAQQAQNSTSFHADDNNLFCKTCSCTVDHSRHSNLEQHRKTKKHIRNCEITQPSIKRKTITTT